ncbi:MAG: CRISPR system precrRNA processing endoribonuclease RAMP protein Cas6 [Desulfamplus sp.]|nr:CRISPR system precrRNA processing endoribonuclease RAMP protein Cas6 [Desulfamplus sp.]
MGKIGIGRNIKGRRSRFVLESVTSEDLSSTFYSSNSRTITMPEQIGHLTLVSDRASNSNLISGADCIQPASDSISDARISTGEVSNDRISNGKILMEIHTPLRIISRQVPVARLPFTLLLRNIIRRTTSLLNVYGDGEPDMDYAGLVALSEKISISANSLKWFDWKRYSSTQDKKMFMGGLVGKIEYQGDFTPFLPFMKMAEKVHVGKNTAFGLGKVSFSPVQ